MCLRDCPICLQGFCSTLMRALCSISQMHSQRSGHNQQWCAASNLQPAASWPWAFQWPIQTTSNVWWETPLLRAVRQQLQQIPLTPWNIWGSGCCSKYCLISCCSRTLGFACNLTAFYMQAGQGQRYTRPDTAAARTCFTSSGGRAGQEGRAPWHVAVGYHTALNLKTCCAVKLFARLRQLVHCRLQQQLLWRRYSCSSPGSKKL